MNRSQARLVAWVLLGSFILFPRLGKVLGIPALSLLGLASLVGMVAVQLAFNRCPHCRAYLGRRGGLCPKCGKSLEE